MIQIHSEKQAGWIACVGVLLPFLVAQVGFIMNPTLTEFAKLFPDLSYSTVSYLATLPSLICIPCNLLAGKVAGKKIGYRPLCMAAIALVVIGGMLPWFFQNFIGWCICRCVMGAGMGLIMPLGGALVAHIFKGDMAVKMQGIGTIVLNSAGVSLQIAASLLIVHNVNYAWLLHGVYIAVFVLVGLFLPEPDREREDTDMKSGSNKFPAVVWAYSVSFGFVFMFAYALVLNISRIIMEEGLGTAEIVGTVTAMFTVGGMAAGLILDMLYRKMGKWLFPTVHILMAASLGFGVFVQNIPGLMMVCFMTGMAVFTIWPASVNEFGNICKPNQVTAASGIFVAALNVGAFLSSAYSGIVEMFLGNNPRISVLTSALGMIVIAICWILGTIKIGKK